MLWFILIVAGLIFAPGLLLVFGAGVIALAVPFVVFFGVWGITFELMDNLFPGNTLAGVVIGFIAGIVAARALVKKAVGG
jgi:hypothetical protein